MKEMKKLIYLALAAALVFGCAKKETEGVGKIYGVITDKALGEPIRSAEVRLNPLGLSAITGTDGQYEFVDIRAGNYVLKVTKAGYADSPNHPIIVVAGNIAKGDVPLEKLPPSLRVVNDKRQNIDLLDFGNAIADITRSFNIFNDGTESLEWQLTETAEWITGFSKADGTLKAGATQAVIVTIDRDKLKGGENTTTVHITSDNGSKELTVKAIGENRTLPVLNTLAATGITATTAILNGEITATGLPSYRERGFVYATTPEPAIENTVEKITAAVTESKEYSKTVMGLTLGQTYYFRAYAINEVGTEYSANEESFTPTMRLPEVKTLAATDITYTSATLNAEISDAGDPACNERGFYYTSLNNPEAIKIVAPATGDFKALLSGLSEGVKYHVRAYALGDAGEVRGEDIEFTTLKSQIATVTTKNVGNYTETTAELGGQITFDGLPSYTEWGVCYGISYNPTVEDNTKLDFSGNSSSVTINELQPGITYHVRAYIINDAGVNYGEDRNFTTIAYLPAVSTGEIANADVTTSSVLLKGTFTEYGLPVSTQYGFCYSSVSQNPDTDDNEKLVVDNLSNNEYVAELTGLTSGTTYYVWAYAVNSMGTAYGQMRSFIVKDPSIYAVVGSIGVRQQDIGIGSYAQAASLCANSNAGGYDDWRLATKDEWQTIFPQRYAISGFTTSGNYWTSTPETHSQIIPGASLRPGSPGFVIITDGYYYINISNGNAKYAENYSSAVYNCRCVRTLP